MALEDYFEGLGEAKKPSALKKNTPTTKKSSILDDYFVSPVSQRATVEAETKRATDSFKGQEISAYEPGKNRIPFKEKLKTFTDNIFHRNESQTAKTMRLQQSAFDDLVDKPSVDDKDGVSPFSSVQKRRETKRSNIPTAKGIVKGLTDVSTSDLPYAGAAIDTVEITKILNSANKIKNGEEIDPEDYLKLKQFLEAQDENSKRMEADAGYRVGSGLRQSLTFMLELLGAAAIAPTSGGTSVATLVSEKGAYMAAKEIALKMSTDAALKAILQKELKTYGVQLAKRGAVVLGTQEATHITNDAFERMIGTPTFTNNMGQVDVTIANDGQSVPEAFTNAFTGILVETGSEFTGGLFHTLPKATRDALIKSGILKEMVEKNKDIPVNALIKITEKLGWHGVFEEMGEEQVGNIAYGVLHSMGLSDVQFTPPTMKGLAEQLLTFSLMGTAMTGVQNGYQKVVAKKLDEEMPSGINNITKPLDEYMNEAIVSLPASEIVTDLKGVGIDAQTASDLVSTYRRKQNKADTSGADAMTPEDIQATIDETLGAITAQDAKELDVNQEGMPKTKADTRKVNPETKGLTPEDLQASIDEIMGGITETDSKTIEEDQPATDMVDGEANDYGDLTNEETKPALEKLKAEPTLENLKSVAATFEDFEDFETTTNNDFNKTGKKVASILPKGKDLLSVFESAHSQADETEEIVKKAKETKKKKIETVKKKITEKKKASTKTGLKEGDKVSYTSKQGEKLTGTITGVDGESSAIDVDQVSAIGGVPIHRKERVTNDKLTLVDSKAKTDIPPIGGVEKVSSEALDAFIAQGEKKTEAKTPKAKETPDEKRSRLENEATAKAIADLSKSDKERILTLYSQFKRMFEIYNEAVEKDGSLLVGEGYDIALEGLIAEGVELSEYEKRFLIENIQYMSDGMTSDIETFTEYAVGAELLSNEGTKDPNYPHFEPADFNEEGVTFVNDGDYIVDRDGYIAVVTSGNMKWKDSKEASAEWNNGYLRARHLRVKQDGMEYANQIRLATPEEIAIAKAYESGQVQSQKEKVTESIQNKAKTIKEIAEETKILEPNVRRILGVGAKEGTFKRLDKGVYILSNNGEDIAYIHTGDSVETLPRLAKEGLKADMIFLDIPYDTPAVKGGNRGVEYNLISVENFGKVLDSVKVIARTEDSPIIHMFSQAPSGIKAMQKYNDLFLEKGFVPVGKGQYQKTFADGSPVTSPNGKVAQPEGILVFTLSGNLQKDLQNLNFTLKRPKGYQTEKPAEMIKAMIEMTTEEGDVVLDPFAGSGVTGAEAVRAGRKAVLIEKNQEVVDNITLPRVNEAIVDNQQAGGTIKSNGTDRENAIPDAGDLPAGDDRAGDFESTGEAPGYDEAAVLAESGNGLEREGATGKRKVGKKGRQLINEQVEELLEAREYSSNPEDYSLEDRTLMAAYTGAGGKESVGAEGAGLLNEYYTPKALIEKVWGIAERLSPTAETAFEPSAGIGRFITESPKGIRVDGAEISKVSGTIARVLNPDSNITIGDFQELFFDKKTNKQKDVAQYDLVVGNPPFGDRAGFLKGKGEEKDIGREEEYFIKRGIDMLKPGGHLVYIVNSSFLKSGTSKGKERIADVGHLIEAYRLPEGIFEDTSIGTDIVVFKKYEKEDPLHALNIQSLRDDMFFRGVSNDSKVLGETKVRKNRFGQTETYVEGDLESALKGINVDKQIVEPLVASNEEVKKDLTTQGKKTSSKEGVAKKADKEFAVGDVFNTGENSNMASPVTIRGIEGNSILFTDANGTDYSGFAKTTARDLIKGGSWKKSEKKQKPPTRSQTIAPREVSPDAIVPRQSVSNKSKYSKEEVTILSRIDRDESIPNPSASEIPHLNYQGGKYYHNGNYFAGEIYEKLNQLETEKRVIIDTLGEDQYNKQKAGLEAVIPKIIPIKDLSFDPIDRHIAEIKTTTSENSYETTVLGAFTSHVRRNSVALSPRVSKYDVIRYVQGERASQSTKPIMGSIKADAKRLFNQFIKNDLKPETQAEIEAKYNKEKNGYVRPDYSQIPTEVENMAKQFRGQDFSLSQTQKEGVGFLVNKGSGMIAYGVGVGKTHTLAIATVANMQKGWTKRPLFVVPKATITKTWLGTLQEMFPTLTINNLEGLQADVVGRLKKEKGEVKNWLKDGELNVISHEGILRLGFNEEELREAAGDLNDALWKEDKTKRGEAKDAAKMDEILGQAQKYVTDIMISDLGIDHLSVDEVHNFRKVFQGAKAEKENTGGRKRFANVIGGTPSKRAQQLFLMSQYVQKRNGNRNVFLASATPFENHATEVYNILSFVARDRMKSMGILNINDFFATFANFEIELDRKLDGTWIDREKMKSFANLPTLQGLLREFIDYQEDETLVRPERRVLTPHLQMSAEQTANLAKIQNLLMGKKEETMIDESDGAEMFSTDEGGKAEDGAFLKASSYSIANSVSPYFIKEYTKKAPTAEELVENSPKIKYAVEVLKTVKDNPKTRDYGTFIYFGKMGVEYHPMIKEYLVEKLGYKSEQVAVLSGNVTDEEKEDIKEKFNNGVVKVLLGGDQTKEGIDLQQNGFITLNLALGWNPTQIAQVEGRVWRQGNKRSIAPLIYPLVENSGDAMIYSKFEEKGGRINDLFSYKGKMFDVGEIDPAEKKLALLTDPKDKANMQIEIDKAALYNERVMLDNDIKELEKIRADKNQTEEDITHYSEILETGERYGRNITKTEVTEYKKELKAAKDRSERIAKKLETKNITDIATSIGVLEGQMLDIDNKIKAIQETYEVKLKHFTELYREDIKNRKSYADHMKEISTIVGELKERTPEEIAGLRAIKIADMENRRRMATPEFSRIADVEFAEKLSLKTLDRLGNRETVSKQFISDLTNMGDIKQVERDVIRDALEGEGNTVDVDAFRKKVNDQLLPLTVSGDIASGETLQRYEHVALPDELRGNVTDYTERVYESPIATSAGDIHFGSSPMGDEGGIQNYFGHTRIEDMADYETRRVIEVQSDLYQKGRLERESMAGDLIQRRIQQLEDEGMYPNQAIAQVDVEIQKGFLKNREAEVKKLKQYNDPTAHFRMVREEVRQAAYDDKTKLQFPTGETAMKIEGLGENSTWVTQVQTKIGDNTYPEDLFLGREIEPKVGMEIQMTVGENTYTRAESDEFWIITDVLGEGKFKAVPKRIADAFEKRDQNSIFNHDTIVDYNRAKETFDISGKVDQNNPIYKFYEKELGRYLKSRYNATRVKDSNGVEWYEVSVSPEAAKAPVEAFLKNTATKERMIKFDEAKARLEAYKTRLGLDFDVDFADVIFTGEVQGAGFQRVRGQAYGVTYNNKITLIDNITETTADHELVHQVVNNIDKIKVFDGITRDQLYKAANGGKAYSQDQITELDEVIAIGFQDKLKGESQSNVPDVLRRFYERLQIAFTKLFQALGGHVDVIQDFYRRLASANASETVKMKSNPALDRGIRFEADGRSVMDFSMSDRVTELVDTTKAGFLKVAELGEQPDFSVNLRRRDMNELDNLLAQARDLYLKDPVEFKEADSFMKIGDERRMKKSILDNRFSEMLKPYFDMKTAERAGVDKVLMQGDMDAKEYNETELAAMGLSKAQIEAYKTVRKGFNTAHQLLIEEMYKSGVKEEEIEQFEKERVGYMPHKWKYRFAIKTQTLKEGNDPREDSSWRTFTMDVYRTAREADKAFQKLRNENKDPNKRFVSDTLDSLDVDFFTEQRFSFENMKSIISKAKTSTDVKTELLSGLRNMIKEKGFGRHFIKRTGIQGYETKEIPSVIANYFSGLNGFVTKMDAGKKYYGVLENIDARRQKKFYAWVRDSIAYDMGNSREWDGLKQVAFIYHLANDISFLLTNATQNFTIGVGEISKLAKGASKLYTGETAILKATVDWAFKRLSPDEKAAITGLLKVGRLGGEMTAELMGFKNNPLYRTVSKTFNKALYHTTSFVEQNVNRVPAFLAARRVLIAQGLSNKEANEQALAVSDDINFRYGKQHRPVFMRGKKGVFFIFNHYIRSYLYQLSRDLKKKEYISVSKKMFYTFLLAGTAGLPFAKLIKLIVKEVFGDDDEEVAKELNTWELAIQRGLPASFLNIDLSGRVGIDVMAISNILEDPGNVLSYLGAVGNLMFDRLPKGYDLLTQERYNEAIAKLLPDMVGTPFKAYNGVEHGVYTQAGNPLIDENGDDFKYTTYEGFVRATGFTPTREQLAWDEMAKEWDSQDKKAAKSADQRAKIKNAIEAGDYEEAKNLQEQGRLDGYLSEEKDYVRNSIKDETIKDKLDQIANGDTNQSLASMEREIAKATYGTNYTAQNLSNVSQEFAYRRTFGFDNKLAEEIWTAKSNAAKVELLKQAREEMGLAEFKKFFEKGRKSVRYQSGRSGHVLISDDLRDLYFGKK